jgi:hypothetical protein
VALLDELYRAIVVQYPTSMAVAAVNQDAIVIESRGGSWASCRPIMYTACKDTLAQR